MRARAHRTAAEAGPRVSLERDERGDESARLGCGARRRPQWFNGLAASRRAAQPLEERVPDGSRFTILGDVFRCARPALCNRCRRVPRYAGPPPSTFPLHPTFRSQERSGRRPQLEDLHGTHLALYNVLMRYAVVDPVRGESPTSLAPSSLAHAPAGVAGQAGRGVLPGPEFCGGIRADTLSRRRGGGVGHDAIPPPAVRPMPVQGAPEGTAVASEPVCHTVDPPLRAYTPRSHSSHPSTAVGCVSCMCTASHCPRRWWRRCRRSCWRGTRRCTRTCSVWASSATPTPSSGS